MEEYRQGVYGSQRWAVVSAVAPLLFCAAASAQVVAWDEAVDGDLSTDPDMPTAIAFEVGTNTVAGRVQASDDTRDFITFTIPEGQQLTAILLQQYEDVPSGGPGDRGFVAINEGD
ncbi:MAG: hypothetical protein AAFX85_11930, partial [Pseudomonadota bacterium]